MNEFLQQFVIESRELMSHAVDGLLRLEQTPGDASELDAVFRAFHTLKGGAGIVEFAAMERTVHAAEEVLGQVRSGQRVVTPALVSHCLASLDQVGAWLEIIQSSGAVPQGDRDADAIVSRFVGLDGVETAANAESGPAEDWAEPLRLRHHLRETAVTAIRYTPSVDCLLQGEDPAARIAGLPQLLAQELAPLAAWPSLSELDPYACNLVLLALCDAPAEAVRAHMLGYVGECEIVELQRALRSDAYGVGGDRVHALLAAQLALLSAEGATRQFPGRLAAAGRAAANVLLSVARAAESREVRKATEQSIADHSILPLTRVLESLLRTETEPETEAASATSPAAQVRAAETTLRIEAARIDALVRLTGELTTAKNALAHTAAHADTERASVAAALKDRLKEFERLIERLQHAVLALRVLPLRAVLQRFPRVVREMSSTLGKPVALHIEGDHTEADKAIVDMLFEPLVHALRNAIDHGVELPARRLELGKPLVATIWIRARRASDRVIVEVEDDGSGVNVQRVRDVALARQLVTPDVLRTLSETEIVDLVFTPGFSTAATVSEISGRGVGLDAVRTAIQRAGGQVSLTSRAGLGTQFTFSLPFSVMVTQVLTVEVGGQNFGVPLDALLETVRVPADRISSLGAARVIVHRDRTLPLIDLAGELNVAPGIETAHGEVIVVLASVSDQVIALRVDRIGERTDVILKPLEGLLVGLRGITGTTLLGDGRVLLVLDLWELLT